MQAIDQSNILLHGYRAVNEAKGSNMRVLSSYKRRRFVQSHRGYSTVSVASTSVSRTFLGSCNALASSLPKAICRKS